MYIEKKERKKEKINTSGKKERKRKEKAISIGCKYFLKKEGKTGRK